MANVPPNPDFPRMPQGEDELPSDDLGNVLLSRIRTIGEEITQRVRHLTGRTEFQPHPGGRRWSDRNVDS